ncbi:MAG: 50S ribosomal protein L11 methyltransferase [Planctomycetes bacterium]|nr:50S ribosomal protein L11 methyltransferase [Planctomycetota bacterium]
MSEPSRTSGAAPPGVPLVWREIAVRVPEGWQELVAERLAACFASGVVFGRASLASEPVPEGFELVRVFAAGARELAELQREARAELAALAERTDAIELAELEVSVRELPPEDFARSWEKRWKPFRVGRIAVVSPHASSKLRAHDLELRLEPGGAFGTGRHTTTRSCLRVIQRRIVGGERVLDAGCGNGVLAVAALLCGAERALGFDVDPHAVPYAAALARENRVLDRCDLRAGGFEALSERDAHFDAVFANIYADLIQRHAAELASRLAPHGWFVFSGCHRDHRAATEAAIAAAGLVIEARASTGRWDTYEGRRRR